jgi:uncharacterized membrane protein YfcA
VGPLSALAIAGAGMAAGFINVVVGSGTLITFPTLLAVGFSPLVANVSNTIGLVPGSLSGAHAYRKELTGQRRRGAVLGSCSSLGAVIGAFLLLELPGTAFRHVVPFLILLACVLVAFQPTLSRLLAPSDRPARRFGNRGQLLYVAVFATGIYGGYFGAAQGVILISLLAIFINERLQRLNAMKNVLVMLANLVSGVIFALSGHVSWEAAGILAVGSTVGGQVGGRFGRRLPQPVLRVAVVVVGTTVAVLLLV